MAEPPRQSGLGTAARRRWAAGGTAAGRWATGVVTGLLAFALLAGGAVARTTAAIPEVALQALPAEAQATEQRIRQGGPFPYAKDGSTFGNRERLLPGHPRGYYREYTVRTPGSRDRGARRIVCGGTRPTLPDACYYTDDHYASFRRIAP